MNSRDRVPLLVILILVFIAAIAALVVPLVLAAAGPFDPGVHYSTEPGSGLQARALYSVGGGGSFAPAGRRGWVAGW